VVGRWTDTVLIPQRGTWNKNAEKVNDAEKEVA
jgi:hypothetical protein